MLGFIITTAVLVSVMPHFSMPTKAAENSDRIIVSMGDSYSSGEGITPFFDQELKLSEKVKSQNWLAHRSKNAWSGMLTLKDVEGEMSDHYNENWFFVAASGAVTGDITGKQKKEYVKDYLLNSQIGVEFLDPQIEVFDKLNKKGLSADYVTLTLGGNDAGFSDVMETTALHASYLGINETYDMIYGDEGIIKKKLPTIKTNIKECYKIISQKSKAPIIVAGYPELLGSMGAVSSPIKNSAFTTLVVGSVFTPYEASMINNAVNIFNDAIYSIVDECDDSIPVYFVSVKDAFKGKGAYSKNEFINGICIPGAQDIDNRSPIGGASFHPNKKGAKAYADCVQAQINKLEGITPRPKPTEKPTDKAVEIPTHKPTETKEYTAVELASKSLDEIIEIMGGDYTSEHVQLSNAFSSSGAPYIYNYDVLPGFAFETYDNYYRGISIMDGAKLNDKISSDMTYNQIADEIGDMEGMLVAQEGNIACSKTVDGYSVAFCFIENDYIRNNKDNSGKITSDVLRGGNPSLQSIGLIMNTEPESEEQPINNSFGMSDEEIKSMLTSDRWILQEVYVDGERYQGNYYGSIISQTGAYIDFNNDGSFKCCLGFVGCNGTYSVNNGSVNITITQNIVDAKTIDTKETKELGWRSEDNTILFDYSAFDSGENVTNAFRQI